MAISAVVGAMVGSVTNGILAGNGLGQIYMGAMLSGVIAAASFAVGYVLDKTIGKFARKLIMRGVGLGYTLHKNGWKGIFVAGAHALGNYLGKNFGMMFLPKSSYPIGQRLKGGASKKNPSKILSNVASRVKAPRMILGRGMKKIVSDYKFTLPRLKGFHFEFKLNFFDKLFASDLGGIEAWSAGGMIYGGLIVGGFIVGKLGLMGAGMGVEGGIPTMVIGAILGVIGGLSIGIGLGNAIGVHAYSLVTNLKDMAENMYYHYIDSTRESDMELN